MSDLLAFQREFADAIARPCRGALAVYRNTVTHGAVEALRSNYPVTEKITGEEMFAGIATGYAAACPPRSSVLAHYGSNFAEWIEEQSWALELPYAADVARFERLHTETLFAADAPALELTSLPGIEDWTRLTVSLHPAARFDWALSPAMHIWLIHQMEVPDTVELDWTAEGGLFTRPGLAVEAMRLDPAAHRLLFGIRLGESVGTSAIATSRIYPDADVGSLFACLVNAGAFAAPSPERT